MRITLVLLIAMSFVKTAQSQVKGYPEGVEEMSYVSSADDTEQPTLFWAPEKSDGPLPLLVALHTWSSDYTQAGGEAVYARWCQQENWVFIHPNFRGPNRKPEALGSDLAVGDVLSAIEFAKEKANIDPERIYCIGVSGGGHMSLLMAGRAPEIWAGVSAWCGISDIAAWHQQCSENERFAHYAGHIEKALGAPPEKGSDALESANHRSPVSWLNAAQAVNLDINHGVKDGRIGSVPFTHSLHAWNAVVEGEKEFPADWIDSSYQSQTFSESGNEANPDPLYGEHQPVFRKTAENTRITIFDGGHQIVHNAALNWLAAQRKGAPAVWELKNTVILKTGREESESGK